MGLEPTTFCMASGLWVRSSRVSRPLVEPNQAPFQAFSALLRFP